MKAVITVVGIDQPGIIAKISAILAKYSVNIDDISQSFAHEFFTMILMVDLSRSDITIKELAKELKNVGQEMGLQISIYHKDVFKTMHRL